MRTFVCPNCGGMLFFHNSECLACKAAVGFDRTTAEMVLTNSRTGFRRCENSLIAVCNLVLRTTDPDPLCGCCALTRTRPAQDDQSALAAFASAEAAKRQLVYQLDDIGLPIVDREVDPVGGLAFDLLSER